MGRTEVSRRRAVSRHRRLRAGVCGGLLAGLVLLGMNLVGSPPAAAASLPLNTTIVAAAAPADEEPSSKCGQIFLGMRPWYHYMNKAAFDANCDVQCFQIFQINDTSPANDCNYRSSDVPGVLLAVIDDLLRVAGLVAIGFVFAGAFKYVESRGNPEKTSQAQSTIINALAGVGIAMVAIAFIAFLGNRLGGS